MSERHPNVLEVLIREIRQDGKADVVLDKSLRVLSETELLQPISDLLHRGSAPDYSGFIRPHRPDYLTNPQRSRRTRVLAACGGPFKSFAIPLPALPGAAHAPDE